MSPLFPQQYTKNVFICIPTSDRNIQLKSLLRSISMQKALPDAYSFEILIINNSISNDLKTISAFTESFRFKTHYLTVKDRGYSNVRNAALSWVLNTDAVALIFVDDDEIVPSGWLARMIHVWQTSSCDIVTGPVQQVLPVNSGFLLEKMNSFAEEQYPESGTRIEYANSNNTLVSRNVLESMGACFHPDFNHTGGEDTHFFHQCYLNGFTICWDNSLVILEPTSPNRATLRYMIKRHFKYGKTRVRLNMVFYPEDWKNRSMQLIRKSSWFASKQFLRSLVKRDWKNIGRTICLSAKVVGLISGVMGSEKVGVA